MQTPIVLLSLLAFVNAGVVFQPGFKAPINSYIYQSPVPHNVVFDPAVVRKAVDGVDVKTAEEKPIQIQHLYQQQYVPAPAGQSYFIEPPVYYPYIKKVQPSAQVMTTDNLVKKQEVVHDKVVKPQVVPYGSFYVSPLDKTVVQAPVETSYIKTVQPFVHTPFTYGKPIHTFYQTPMEKMDQNVMYTKTEAIKPVVYKTPLSYQYTYPAYQYASYPYTAGGPVLTSPNLINPYPSYIVPVSGIKDTTDIKQFPSWTGAIDYLTGNNQEEKPSEAQESPETPQEGSSGIFGGIIGAITGSGSQPVVENSPEDPNAGTTTESSLLEGIAGNFPSWPGSETETKPDEPAPTPAEDTDPAPETPQSDYDSVSVDSA